ncbi:MAG: ABC transporter permease, partial [Vicinamibacterales bacterium]
MLATGKPDNWVVLHDLRQAVRNLARSPWAALVIALSLALGTGANAAVYSAVDALLFRAPAGVTGASGLVDIYTSQFNGGTYGESSYPDVQSLSTAPELAGVAILEDRNQASVAMGRASGIARVAAVSDGFWNVLGMQPAAGAWPAAATSGAAVISDELWRSLGGSAEMSGAHITIEHREFTIAAIAPPSFRGLHLDPTFDVWIPLNTPSVNRGDRRFAVIGRLAPAAAVDRLQASVDTIGGRLASQYPATNVGSLRRPDEARRFTVIPYSRFDPSVRWQLPLLAAGLFFVTGLLLLSACV